VNTWMQNLRGWLVGHDELPKTPSPAEVAPRVRARSEASPPRPAPAAPPVLDTDPGRTPWVDPMLWAVIEPIDMPTRRPYQPPQETR